MTPTYACSKPTSYFFFLAGATTKSSVLPKATGSMAIFTNSHSLSSYSTR